MQGVSADVFDVIRNVTLYERDIPESFSGSAELYSSVRDGEAPTIRVPLDDAPVGNSVALRGISSSRYTPFDDKEHNILVERLTGCTSLVVVSRKGASPSILSKNL